MIGARISHLGLLARGPSEAESREIQGRIVKGRDWSGELWIHHPAGQEFPVHARISPVHGRHTTPVAVVAISKDITDRKHNEAVLRRFSAMVESSGDAIVSADMTGTTTSWIPGGARMSGKCAREAVGKNYRLLTTP